MLEPVFFLSTTLHVNISRVREKPLLGELSSLGFVLSLQTLMEVLGEVILYPSHSQLTSSLTPPFQNQSLEP